MCVGTSLKVQWTLKTLEDSELPKQGAWVRLLIRELGSHMPHNQKKKIDYMNSIGVLQKLLYILAPPLSLWNSPSVLSERLYPRLKSSLMLPNKIQFSTLGCAFFFFKSTKAPLASNHLMPVTHVLMTKKHLHMLPNVPVGD